MSDNTEKNPIDVSDIVSMHYEMNPETDDIIHSDRLQYGMRVLVEDPQSRESLEKMRLMEAMGVPFDAENLSRIRKLNRWCKVTHMRLMGDTVTFIGIYDDGVKCLRTSSITDAWLVKRDSIPVESDAEAEIWSKICTIVVETAMIDRRFTDAEREQVIAKVGHYADKIMEVVMTNLDVLIDDLEQEDYEAVRQSFLENAKKPMYRTWKEELERSRIPIQVPEYLMDHHPDPNPTKIDGKSYDEMVENERAKQKQFEKDRAEFRDRHSLPSEDWLERPGKEE